MDQVLCVAMSYIIGLWRRNGRYIERCLNVATHLTRPHDDNNGNEEWLWSSVNESAPVVILLTRTSLLF